MVHIEFADQGTTSTKTSSTTCSVCSDTTWITDYVGWVSFPIQVEEEKEIIIPKKIIFDRVLKMRNTDGRLFKPILWKPIRG